MEFISPEQKLEIARRVRETFESADDWLQGAWGLDDAGKPLGFGSGLHATDEHGRSCPPALGIRSPTGLRCFCLGAAIRIHTGTVLDTHSAGPAALDEEMCQVYVHVGALQAPVSPATFSSPYLDILVDWNDRPGRTFADVQRLAGAAVDHLEEARWNAR